MNERRLARGGIGVVVFGAVCAAGLLVGCAQPGEQRADEKRAPGAAGGEETDLLVARSAAGLERVLSGEQRKAEEGERAKAHMAKVPSGGAEAGRVDAPVSGDVQRRSAADGPPVVTDDGARPVAGVAGANSCAPPAAAPVAAPAPSAAASGGGVLSGWWGAATVEGDSGVGGAAPAAAPAARGAEYWKAEGGSAESASLRISALALCTRVDGFGRFNRVESVRATGRPVPLLVYTQVDGFSYKGRDGSTRGGEAGDAPSEWVIELGQSVVVYRMGVDGKSDVQVKVEPEQVARDVASFKRRDHFLVQRIELPTPLVAGKYVVKVSVRDKGTGMVDERTAEVVVR